MTSVMAIATSGSKNKGNKAEMAALGFQEIAKYLPEEGEDYVKKLKSVFRFEVDGGHKEGGKTWLVDLKSGKGKVIEGAEGDSIKADTTFKMSDAMFVELGLGKANPQMAFMRGKIKLQGNLGLALRFNTVVLQKNRQRIKDVYDKVKPASKL